MAISFPLRQVWQKGRHSKETHVSRSYYQACVLKEIPQESHAGSRKRLFSQRSRFLRKGFHTVLTQSGHLTGCHESPHGTAAFSLNLTRDPEDSLGGGGWGGGVTGFLCRFSCFPLLIWLLIGLLRRWTNTVWGTVFTYHKLWGRRNRHKH